MRNLIGISGFLVGTVLSVAASAQDIGLPSQMSWTANDTGSSGFSIAVAQTTALKEKYGTNTRILPVGSEPGRLRPLIDGRVEVTSSGSGLYFAQEGVFEFAAEGWGPTPLRMLLSSSGCAGLTPGVATDTGVKEFKDLKGKRVAVVVGYPSNYLPVEAALAFGGLTLDDVTVVEFSSFSAAWEGILNGNADATTGATTSSAVLALDSSPRGVYFPPMPLEDKEGWNRFLAVAPWFTPTEPSCGVGYDKDNPPTLGAYPYPVNAVMDALPTDTAYAVTKGLIDAFPLYEKAASGAAGFALDKQKLEWVIPYHEGAIRALTEAGNWTDSAQAHNDQLIKRQDVLQNAWQDFTASNPSSEKDAFTKGWMAARAEALEEAGMEVVFK